jgi:hypothetical protein
MTTRSAGTRVQFDTDGCEMPIWRASSLTPPTARIASLRPESRIGFLVSPCFGAKLAAGIENGQLAAKRAASYLSMILPENRFPSPIESGTDFFGIML